MKKSFLEANTVEELHKAILSRSISFDPADVKKRLLFEVSPSNKFYELTKSSLTMYDMFIQMQRAALKKEKLDSYYFTFLELCDTMNDTFERILNGDVEGLYDESYSFSQSRLPRRLKDNIEILEVDDESTKERED